ncbi:MAG: hypothetical protein WBV73_01260 [Phormidium sp.]
MKMPVDPPGVNIHKKAAFYIAAELIFTYIALTFTDTPIDSAHYTSEF